MANGVRKDLKRYHLGSVSSDRNSFHYVDLVAADIICGENALQSWTNRVKTWSNREQSDKPESSSEFITRSKASNATQDL